MTLDPAQHIKKRLSFDDNQSTSHLFQNISRLATSLTAQNLIDLDIETKYLIDLHRLPKSEGRF